MPSKWFVPESYLIHEKGAIMARDKLGPTYVLIHAYTEVEHAEVKQMRQKLPEHLAAYLANPDSVLTQDYHEEVARRQLLQRALDALEAIESLHLDSRRQRVPDTTQAETKEPKCLS